jgi:hypothetical protein
MSSGTPRAFPQVKNTVIRNSFSLGERREEFRVTIMYAQYRNIGKSNNSKVFGSNKAKGSKHESQHQLRSHMPEGGEP